MKAAAIVFAAAAAFFGAVQFGGLHLGTRPREPRPLELTKSMTAPSRATAQPTTASSAFLSFMPRTPAVARPIGRTSFSVKRMVMPPLETSRMSESPGACLVIAKL